jgi:rhodanese-related sulfurtransferase
MRRKKLLKRKRLIILIIIAAAIIAGYFFAPFSPRNDSGVNVAKINREISKGDAVLMDVRTAMELAKDGYAANSVHFELARLQNGELPTYPKDMKIYVYCKVGGRAGQAEEILENNGFSNVINIGGLVDWETSGGEVIR